MHSKTLMLKLFKRGQSLLEEMATDIDEQPSLVPDKPTLAPMPLEEPEVCPKCGTMNCLSLEEYQSHLKMFGCGGNYIDPKYILQSCSHRRALNTMREIEKENPGIWGKPYNRNNHSD